MLTRHGMQIRVTSGLRTFEEQLALYNRGRTTPGRIVTNAKPGESMHSYGVAVDICFAGKDPYLDQNPNSVFLWNEFARFGRSAGFFPGLDFKTLVDKPHLEMRYGGLDADSLFILYERGGLRAVWAKLDQVRGIPIGSEWKLPNC